MSRSLCGAAFLKCHQTGTTSLAKQLCGGGQTQQCKQPHHLVWACNVSHTKFVSSKENVRPEKLSFGVIPENKSRKRNT